ncbi:MAG: hypothetical protein B7Y45_01675 [Sphingomonas sp. 28-66-16]|nr:MAG: hypothetical protein B7Y45_01675 [Sphingomonas sp. 28-66-16]
MAGGRSRRFGADKARAQWNGEALIAHSVARLAPQVDALVVCGPSWRGVAALPDRPAPDLGPLAAINAALHHGAAQGFDAVLSVPVDVQPLPDALCTLLAGIGAAVLDGQKAIGWWPVALATRLDGHIAAGGRSLDSWIAVAGCRRIDDTAWGLVNVNRPDDLQRLIDQRETP